MPPMAKDIKRGFSGSRIALCSRAPSLRNRRSCVSLADGRLLLSCP